MVLTKSIIFNIFTFTVSQRNFPRRLKQRKSEAKLRKSEDQRKSEAKLRKSEEQRKSEAKLRKSEDVKKKR